MKPFEFLNICFEKKKHPTDQDIDKYLNQYLLNMVLSCDKALTGLAAELSMVKITNKMYYDCLYYGLPKTKKYIKYNAKKAAKDEEIQWLMEYYNCSQQVAKEYHAIISDEEMKEIKTYFTKRGIK